MTMTNRTIQKMTSNRQRLAHGETNERRDRNDKLHKPERVAKTWSADIYDPQLNKRLAARKRALSREAIQTYTED